MFPDFGKIADLIPRFEASAKSALEKIAFLESEQAKQTALLHEIMAALKGEPHGG